jgi:hypothetical protein
MLEMIFHLFFVKLYRTNFHTVIRNHTLSLTYVLYNIFSFSFFFCVDETTILTEFKESFGCPATTLLERLDGPGIPRWRRTRIQLPPAQQWSSVAVPSTVTSEMVTIRRLTAHHQVNNNHRNSWRFLVLFMRCILQLLAYKRHVIQKKPDWGRSSCTSSTVVSVLAKFYLSFKTAGNYSQLQRYPQSYYRNFFGENLVLKFRCAIIPQLTLLPSKFRGNLSKIILMARE